jgi:thiol-disulfide isomerase/thioredoxin
MKSVRLIVLVIAAHVLASGTFAQVPDRAPTLALKDLKGRTVRLEQFRGKVVLVNFWATWCPPCRAEMPELVRLQREHAKRGLQIVGVTHPPYRRASVRRFARRIKVNYPVLLGTREAAHVFEVGEILPLTLVFDGDGRLRGRIVGILEPEEFAGIVEPLLR